ncbi:MAG: tetratricopeptide repeat protein, partial [Nitrospinota bacterium]
NMSEDPEQEYFSDGITEDIITDLSRLPNLFVIARHSTFTYKGKPVKVKQVAEELGVRYVLEGSFRKAGQRARITAQLVDATTGRHVWAERYDREFKDIFALQDDITEKVVMAMEVKLTTGEAARIARRQTDNPEAYKLFRRGLDQFRRFNKVGNAQARRLFEKAVSLDPNFAAVWPMLAMTHLVSARFGWSADPARDYARAEELVRKALAIDDSNSDAYRVLGQIFLEKRQHEKAIAHGEKSVTLEPNHSINTLLLGRTLIYVGRPEEAVELFKRGMRLSPYYSTTFLRFLGNAYRMMGQYDEAIEVLERGRAPLPNSPLSFIWLAAAYAEAGKGEEARAAAAEILKRDPKFSVKRFAKAAPYKDPAELKRALNALRKAGLPD